MSQINLQHGTTTNSGETGRLESKNGYAQKYISVNRSKGPATPLTLTPTQSAQTIREPTNIIGADFHRATVAIAAPGENTFRFGPPSSSERRRQPSSPRSSVRCTTSTFVLFEFFVL